jgi:hypothetical protein
MTITQAEASSWEAYFAQQVGDYMGLPPDEYTMGKVHVIPQSEWGNYEAKYGAGNSSASFTVGSDIYIPSNLSAQEFQGRLAYEQVHVQQGTSIGAGDTTKNGKLVAGHNATFAEAQAQALKVRMGYALPNTLDALGMKFLALSPEQNAQAMKNLAQGAPVFNASGGVYGANNVIGSGNANAPRPIGVGDMGETPPGYGPSGAYPISPLAGVGSAGPNGAPNVPGIKPVTTGPTPQQIQNTESSWLNLLNSWGMKPDASLTNWIDSNAKNGVGSATFLNWVRTTPEYQKAFPGIQGSGLSEASYRSRLNDYNTAAAANGVTMTPALQQMLFNNNISYSTASQRFQAEASLKSNQALFNAFNKQLVSEGQAQMGKGDMLKFIMGEGNAAWYKTWNDANSRYGGNQAGITFNGKGMGGNPASNAQYTNLGKGVISTVAGKGLSPAEEQRGYQQLAQQLTTSYPLSKIQKFGLTKADLVQLQFGGPRQAHVAGIVKQITENESNIEDQSNKVGVMGIAPFGQGTQQGQAQV